MEDRIWTKEFILLNIIQVGINLGYFGLYSTIGIFSRGLTSVELYVGLITGIFTFAALMTRFVSGRLMNRYTVKRVLLFGLVILTASSVGYLVSHEILFLLFMRVLNGLGYGLASAAAATLISSSLPQERLLEGLGYNMMFFSICGAIGPSMVLGLTHSDAGQFYKAFWVVLILSVMAVVLAFFAKEPLHTESKQEEKQQGKGAVTVATGIFILLAFLLAFSQSSVIACLNLYALDYSLGNMSMYFIIFSAANFITRLFMRRILKMLPERLIFIMITAISIIVYIGIFLAPSRYVIFLLAIPFGFAIGFYYPLVTTKTLKTMPPEQQATSNSLYLAGEDFGFFMGAIFWSGISPMLGGYRNIYLLAAVFATLMLLIVAGYPKLLAKINVKEDVWEA